MPKSEKFKSRFVKLIEPLNANSVQIAKMIGTTTQTVCDARYYGMYPSVYGAMRIADYFNVSLDYLLGLTDDDTFVKSENPVTFGERLRQLREAKPSSNIRIDTKVNPVVIKAWESANRFPLKWRHLFSFAEFYDVSFDYLLCRTDKHNEIFTYLSTKSSRA